MLKKILFAGFALAAAYMVFHSIPDLARYLKLRDM